MSDIGKFFAFMIFLAALGMVFKLWLFMKHPEAYKRLEEYDQQQRAKAWNAGKGIAGFLWSLYQRR
jgi:hypothetical protein